MTPGIFVDLAPTECGDLRLVLTPAGREGTEEFRIEKDRRGTLAALIRLLADHLEGDWEWIPLEDLAALTSAPILGIGIDRDAGGELRRVEHLYWFPDYAVRDEVEELLATGEITFDRAPSDPDEERPFSIGQL